MTSSQKQDIADLLKQYTKQFDSKNKASASLKGVSSATVSHILASKWDKISDDMWRKVGAQVNYNSRHWNIIETTDYALLTSLLQDAQDESTVRAIVGDAGTGKSETIAQYVRSHTRAYHLKCAEFWSERYFLSRIFKEMGRNCSGYRICDMMEALVLELKKQENPIIILDEADKLSDKILRFLITFYNELEGDCAIVLCSTRYLKARIKKGVNAGRKGFDEVSSRLNRHIFELEGLTPTDIAQVCYANGIDSKKQVKDIISNCQSDLRVIKDEIKAIKKDQQFNTETE